MKIKDTARASAALWNQVHMLSESRIQKTGVGPLLSRRQMPTILSQGKMILSVFVRQAAHHCLMTSKENLRGLRKRSNNESQINGLCPLRVSNLEKTGAIAVSSSR